MVFKLLLTAIKYILAVWCLSKSLRLKCFDKLFFILITANTSHFPSVSQTPSDNARGLSWSSPRSRFYILHLTEYLSNLICQVKRKYLGARREGEIKYKSVLVCGVRTTGWANPS